jgi:hypothetical protein
MTVQRRIALAALRASLAALIAGCASCPDGMQVKWYVKQAEPQYEAYLVLLNASQQEAELTQLTLNDVWIDNLDLKLVPGSMHTMPLVAYSEQLEPLACVIPREVRLQCNDNRPPRRIQFDSGRIDSVTLEVMRPSCPRKGRT